MGDFKGDARSLDYSSYLLWQRLQLATFSATRAYGLVLGAK